MTEPRLPGLASYAVRDRLAQADAKETRALLSRISDMGYKTMELRPEDYSLSASDMWQAMKEVGLDICAMHAEMTALDSEYAAVVRRFETMGCRQVVIPSRPREETDIPRFLDKVAYYARRLNADGLSLQYHNHVAEFAKLEDGTTMMSRLLRLAEGDLFAIEVDVGWVQVAGLDPVRFIEELPVEVGVVHFRDVTAAPDFSNRSATLYAGGGYLDWKAIAAACRNRGVRHYVAEHRAEGDSMAIAAKAAEKILSLV